MRWRKTTMQRVFAVLSTLFRCGIVGGGYGAGLGVTYGLLLGVIGALKVKDPTFFESLLPVAILYGALIGFPAGFLSGVLGGFLGGPVGCAIGGVIGTCAVTLPLDQGGEGLSSP